MLNSITQTLSSQKWKLTRRVLFITSIVTITKLVIHYSNLEFLPLSSLFTAIISANIFLISFLITGVLADYKESEKLPGDLAVSLDAITDEMAILYKSKNIKIVKEGILHTKHLSARILAWFYKK